MTEILAVHHHSETKCSQSSSCTFSMKFAHSANKGGINRRYERLGSIFWVHMIPWFGDFVSGGCIVLSNKYHGCLLTLTTLQQWGAEATAITPYTVHYGGKQTNKIPVYIYTLFGNWKHFIHTAYLDPENPNVPQVPKVLWDGVVNSKP